MKLTKTLTTIFATLTFVILGCDEKKITENKDPHEGQDHSGHAHDTDKHKDHDDHDHAKKTAGPNGGRIIIAVKPHAEFFVTIDRKVRITFLGEDNKAIPVTTQSVSIVCGDRANPTNLTLVKEADGLSFLTSDKLPAGNSFPAIVTFKTTLDSTPLRARFTVNLTDCSRCKYKEYACTCDHEHGH